MPLKGIEQSAAELLEHWLIHAGHPTTWKPVTADPPDLEYEVEGLGRWAVEVTEMHEYLGQQTGQEVKPVAVIAARMVLHAVARKIKARFADRELHFRYSLHIEGPLDRTQAEKVEQAAVEFIENGEEGSALLGKEEDIELGRVTSNIKTLALSNNLPGKIYEFVGLDPTTAGGDGHSYLADIEASHNTSITRVLQSKLPKLEKLIGYDRRVLLIWNSYFFGEEDLVRDLLGKATLHPNQIDCIFFADDGNIFLVANPGGVTL